ncbi:aromatic ring-hydroxylating oxygenase subunit alpha [Xylophilus sp. GOD-11R]|uniref:aromatic ring-hydroxylating oxygenase subunit alpha n=1 Tax=Xylophilus sp. GOD-11R TaxID=3089814 RepID=UPI00298D3FBC|nr:Rieske 2Fe-2S domain-containing protein [Xylophilus sp. GOD-11R]WPB57166.1 Rieske 2Fe-2S domain-containing protein [Xylophilus sp. GOD-11R]
MTQHQCQEEKVWFARTEQPSAATEGLVLKSPKTFRVHTRAYTDPAVFNAEMDRIFNKTWVFVAHESQIPHPGDFQTSYMGQQPIIVSRGLEGEVHVMVNRCVHRGAVICREHRGNVTDFNCPYHGWVYGLDGSLLAMSERREAGGYADDFDAPKGLHRVPRVEVYRGFVFACFDPEVKPLLEHLGRAKTVIDRKLDMSPVGQIEFVSRPYVGRYQGNWKFQAENIVDEYHFMHTHKGFVQLQAKYGQTTGDFDVHKGGSVKAMRKVRFAGVTWDCVNGHGLVETPSGEIDSYLGGEYKEFFQGIVDTHGGEMLASMTGKLSAAIFPNMGLIHNQVRVWRPIAPDMTEVTIYPYELKGAPAGYNEGMLRSQERFYGPAGHGQADDVEIFARNQQGLAGSAVEWLILERGVDTDTQDADGNYKGLTTSEAPQRALWREWDRLMNPKA